MLQYAGSRAAVRKAIREGAAFLRDNTIRSRREISNDDGTVTLRAKAVDRFQFVMRPTVTVDPERQTIVSCACDCEEGALGLCSHTAALLLSIGEQIEVPDPAPQLPIQAEPAVPGKDEITIRVVHEGQIPAGRQSVPGPEERRSPERFSPAPQPAPKAEPAPEPKPEPAPEPAPEPKPEPKPEPAPEPAPEPEFHFTPPGIRVLIGDRKSDEEAVYWMPNDTEQILHPNMGIIGTMGTGKTQFTKSVIYQVNRDREANYGSDTVGILIFDYKGDYNETKQDFVESVGARVLKPYRLPYNPLALVQPRTFKPLLPIHTANAFKDTISKIYRLGPKQQQFLLDCIRKAYAARGIRSEDQATWTKRPPTLANVHEIYTEEVGDRAPDSLTAALNKLHEFRIFDDNPVAAGSIRDLMKGVVVIDLSGYDPDIQNLVVAITLDQFYAQMLSLGSSRTDGRYRELRQLILVDEADNFMQEDFPSLRKILKEGREFGVGTILSTQSLSHFIGGSDDYSRYMLTWVVHATGDLKQKDVEYIFKLSPKSTKTASIYTTVKGLEKHQSVVKISNSVPEAIRDMPFWKLIQEERRAAEEPDGEDKKEE